MNGEIVIQPMTGEFVVWRCLHGGSLCEENIDPPQPDERMRERNLSILRELIDFYGTCAMLAMDGDQVVGILRFYPRAIWNGHEGFCMQQWAPEGPAEDLIDRVWPPLEAMRDRTLRVHCLMVGSRQQNDPYRRRGIGTRLVQELITWASEQGWQAIEAIANQGLPVLWEISGGADQRFWQRFGFEYVETFVGETVEPGSGLYQLLQEQASQLGIDPNTVRDLYRMRLDLT